MKLIEQSFEQFNAYSLFVYAVRSQVTKDYYLRRLRISLIIQIYNLIKPWKRDVITSLGMEQMIHWAFNVIIRFLQYQKERVEKEEITGATLRNFVKAIKLFCEHPG